jgi:hypothetical protein
MYISEDVNQKYCYVVAAHVIWPQMVHTRRPQEKLMKNGQKEATTR